MSNGKLLDVFDPRRLFLLLKRDLVLGFRGLLVMIATVGGAVFTLSVLSMLFGKRDTEFYSGFFGLLLFLGGYIYTSSIFRELHQSGTGPHYLTLPGTTLEKFASKLLTSSVGYAAGVLIIISAAAGVSELANRVLFGAGHAMFNPFDAQVYRSIAVYLVTSAVFLLGSVWFKKLAFIKTALSVSVLFIVLTVVMGVVLRLLFADVTGGAYAPPPTPELFGRFFAKAIPEQSSLAAMWRNGVIPTVLDVLFYGVMPAACWLISYLRLSETEA